MKKLLTFTVSSALVFSLAACSGQSAPSENTTAAAEEAEEITAEAATETSVNTDASEETIAPEEALEGGVLVAYFSWSGNTEQIAQLIAEKTGADLFEIAPVAPYTDDYNELLDIAQQEQADNARPELAAQVENWDSYDTVFVGTELVERCTDGCIYIPGEL